MTSKSLSALLVLCLLGCEAPSDDRPGDALRGVSRDAVVQPTTAVGRSPGTADVSDTGSMSYRIPLVTPPGVHDVQLNLALMYGSRGGNGPFGMGWSLAGLSSIHRCTPTYDSNGNAGRITHTASDRFCLEGQQLKLISGSYGAAGSTYGTELDAFSLVTANGQSGNGPATFTVRAKNGLVYTYGTNGGRVPLDLGSTTTFEGWHLSEIADRQGNRIVLTWSTLAGETARLMTIDYPYVANGQGPFYRVALEWEARPDLVSGYFGGSIVRQSTRVRAITTSVFGGAVIRSYGLTYRQGTTTGRSQLVNVQECGATTCLSPTSIDYHPGSTGFSTTPVATSTSSVGCGVIPADLNGDGRSDMVFAPVTTTSNGKLTCPWRVRFSNGTGYSATEVVLTGFVTNKNEGQAYAGAFLGNSRQQLILPVPNQSDGSSPVYRIVDYNPSSGALTSYSTGIPQANPTFLYGVPDLDGDGLADLVFGTGRVQNGLLTAFPNLSGTLTVGSFGSSQVLFAAPGVEVLADTDFDGNLLNQYFIPDAVQFSDFNHDGLTDVVVHTKERNNAPADQRMFANVLLSNGRTAGSWPYTLAAMTPGAKVLKGSAPFNSSPLPSFVLLDWTGDGCADYAIGGQIGEGNCEGGFWAQQTLPTALPYNATTRPLGLDYDGDGRQDLLYRSGNAVWWMRATPANGFNQTGANPVATGITLDADALQLMVHDLQGDGHLDLGLLRNTTGGQNVPTVYLHTGPVTGQPLSDIAVSFVDGYERSQVVQYVPLTSGYYVKGSTAVYPEQDYQGPLYVVNRVTTSDGTTTFNNGYLFGGARVHTKGRGFEGFATKSTTDSRTTVGTYETFNLRFPHTGTVASSVVQRSFTSGIPPFQTTYFMTVSRWQGTPATVVTGGSGGETRLFRYASPETTTRYESGGSKSGQLISTTTTSSIYDTFGNRTQRVVSVVDNDTAAPASPFAGQTWTTTEDATFYNSVGNWCLGLPASRTVTGSTPGQPSLVRTTTFSADLLSCRTTQRNDEPNTPALNTTTTYGYDPCGNQTSIGVVGHDASGAALATRLTTRAFGTRCQLPETFTNALSQVRSQTYDYRLGVTSSLTDESGLTTSWQTDDYGRPTRESRPDGTFSTVAYNRETTSDLRFTATTTHFGSDGSTINVEKRTTDAFDRVRLETELKPLTGSTVTTTSTRYDALGRVIRQEVPFSSTSNGAWVYAYDPLNRLTSQKLYRSDGTTVDRTITYAYAGLSFTETDPRTNAVTKTVDVAGRLRRLVDPAPGGTTSYTYDSFGRLISVTDPSGVASSTTYNVLGYATARTDPDQGSSTIFNDSLGERTGLIDAKNQTFAWTYDLLGRLRSRSEAEGLSKWTWGSTPASRNVGKLISLTGPGYSDTRTYDGVGRLSNRTIATVTQSYAFDSTYDAQGFLDTVTYPASPTPSGSSRFVLKHRYSNGRLVRLSELGSSETNLWVLGSTNDWLQPTTATFGRTAVVSTVVGFVPWTGLVSSVQAGIGGSTTNRQNVSYAWDTTDNLTSRQDLRFLLTESFTPDALNRLASSTLNGTTNLTVGYDASGNISSRSDVGTYIYGDPAHRHAVTSAGSQTYSYDANGNALFRNGVAQSWASFNLPTQLSANGQSTTFTYGPERQRIRQVSTGSSGNETIEYVGNALERVQPATGAEQWRHLISTPGGGGLIVTRSATGVSTLVVLDDHLGSTTAVLSDDTGAVLHENSYAAFGARRHPTTWSGTPSSADWAAYGTTTRSGFTGQSQLDFVGLVHFGGRVYDPGIGRFLSVDPVGRPGGSQSLNPYAYVDNRPLSATDPSGWLSEDLGLDDAFDPFDLFWDSGEDSGGGGGGEVYDMEDYGGGDGLATAPRPPDCPVWQDAIPPSEDNDAWTITIVGQRGSGGGGVDAMGAQMWPSEDSGGPGLAELVGGFMRGYLAANFKNGGWGTAPYDLYDYSTKTAQSAGFISGWKAQQGCEYRGDCPTTGMAPIPARIASVTLYRGVAKSTYPQWKSAKKGEAVPRGGGSTIEEHVKGNTRSNYTSWSEKKDFAQYSAGPGGIVLERTFDTISLLRSEYSLGYEAEWLATGPVKADSFSFVSQAQYNAASKTATLW